MEPLVFYAAVAKNNIIIADYQDVKTGDFAHVAVKCLEHIPILHSKFSYTASNRMFICLIEGPFVYCAVMDEALSKAKAYMFLEHVRDAFKVLLQQRDVHVDTLTSHSLHREMEPFFRYLALPFVGMPQREKVRLREEEEESLRQSQRDAEHECDVSSPSAVAPLKEMSDEDFDLQTERKPSSACSRSPHIPLIGKKRGKKKTRDYEKGVISSPVDSSREALNRGKGLEIMTDDSSSCERSQSHLSGWHIAQNRWWHHVKLVILLDLLVCVALLAIWLAVCQGVKCLKKD